MSQKLIFVLIIFAWRDCMAWNYDTSDNTDGPSAWSDTYPDCGGDNQSPIDIDTDDVDRDDDLDDFEFDGYSTTSGVTMTLQNTGTNAQLSVTGATMTLSGGDLREDYIFAQLHFHFGSVDTQGSEHAINGEKFPMEMHVVHYASQYASMAEAIGDEEGYVVLSFLFEISDDDNENLDEIVSGLSSITTPGASTTVSAFSVKSLFDGYTDRHYRYSGSFTSPGCQERVVWSVFKDPIPVSTEQLDEFRTLLDTDSNDLEDNFRPLQAVNGRTITEYKKNNAQQSVQISVTLLIAALFVVSL